MVVVSVAIAGLSCSAALAQLIRSWRTKSAAGLSPLFAIGVVTSCTAWGLYGVVRHVPVLIIANLCWIVAYLYVLHRMVCDEQTRWSPAIFVASCVACVSAVGIGYFGIGILATVGMVVENVNRVPLWRECWRHPGGKGVSVMSFALTAIIAVLWAMMGLLLADPVLIAASGVSTASAVYVIVMTMIGRRAQALAADQNVAPAY